MTGFFTAYRLVKAIDNLAIKTPISNAKHLLTLYILAGSDTAPTQDALGHITDNMGVFVLNGVIVLPQSESGQSYVHVGSNLAQFTKVSLVTYQTGIRVAGQHKLNQYPACLQDLRGMGLNNHAFSDWGMTGANQSPGALHLNDTESTGSNGG